MKAMIFAAGRGERMGALTESTPKPLLQVNGKPLIGYTLENLKDAGITDVVINVAYLGKQIEQTLGEGDDYGVRIQYSFEPYPLETAGAIVFASRLLGDEPFLLTNADVWTDFNYRSLLDKKLPDQILGHLVMVNNPDHNPAGDFVLEDNGLLSLKGNSKEPLKQSIKNTNSSDEFSERALTFSGISVINPALVLNYHNKRQKFPLAEVFKDAIEKQALTGEHYEGLWRDIGTPERLQEIQT